ncbi:MAG: hypothetical protein ACE5E7_14660 [Anaerolineae bacterium]
MFEVDGVYANRKGKYKVLAINPPKMSVRYEDGTLAELNINVQERIWENILVEQQAQTAKEESKRRKGLQSARHFIKMISIPSEDEFMFPGWQERVVMDPGYDPAVQIKAGDRLIHYAIEAQVFFAVATITGKAFEANPIDYFYPTDKTSARFFPVDMDASAPTLELALPRESVELESHPDFQILEPEPESFLPITEDEFELLAELLTEVTEDETETLVEDEDFEEDE